MSNIIHTIKIDKNKVIVYYPEIQEIFETSALGANILNDHHVNLLNYIQLANKYKISETDINNFTSKFLELVRNSKIDVQQQQNIDIKLILSNNCNLNCKYCYAIKYRNNSNMTFDVANYAISFILKNFTNSKIHITFFGGEPLLNVRTMKHICDKIKTLPNENLEFSFGIVTNGTLLSKNILKLIKLYNIVLTISLDGPLLIHNKLRVYNNQSGTYSDVVKNLRIFQENKVKLFYEATYTSLHQKLGFSRKDIHDFIQNELGIMHGYVINSTNSGKYDPKPISNKLLINKKVDIEYFKNNYWTYLPFQTFIFKKRINCICGIGKSHLAISSNGDIYPCQLFINEPDYIMGNVSSKTDNYRDSIAYKKLDLLDHNKNVKCKNCWARYLCKDCPGSVFKETKDIKYTDKYCKTIKMNIEKMLIELFYIKKNEKDYKKLIYYLKKEKEMLIKSTSS